MVPSQIGDLGELKILNLRKNLLLELPPGTRLLSLPAAFQSYAVGSNVVAASWHNFLIIVNLYYARLFEFCIGVTK